MALLTLEVVRRAAELTQDELAEMIGVAQASISYWERGAYELPAKHATRILRIVKPRLERRTRKGAIPESVLKGLTKQDLRKPWDELLFEHYRPRAVRAV